MMIGKGWIKVPEDVVVQLQVEMTVKEARQIRDHIKATANEYWPYRRFAEVLGEVIDQVEKTAYANAPEKPGE